MKVPPGFCMSVPRSDNSVAKETDEAVRRMATSPSPRATRSSVMKQRLVQQPITKVEQLNLPSVITGRDDGMLHTPPPQVYSPARSDISDGEPTK